MRAFLEALVVLRRGAHERGHKGVCSSISREIAALEKDLAEIEEQEQLGGGKG